jgi:hypothetical protein
MKYLTLITLGFCILISSVSAKEVTGKTYRFTLPDEVRFESNEQHEFYSFHWGGPTNSALLMLHPNPAPISLRALKPMAEMMQVTFEDQMKAQGQASEIETKRSDLTLGDFQGVELEFTIKHDSGITIKQWIWILHDGTHAWNGQLTAHSAEDIGIAHKIIEHATRIENTPENSNTK